MSGRWVTMAAVTLAGCAARGPVAPEPLPPPVIVVRCVPPAALFAASAPPAPPAGEYTQRDVARYVLQLHGWGDEGWRRIAALSAWAEACEGEERGDTSPEHDAGAAR